MRDLLNEAQLELAAGDQPPTAPSGAGVQQRALPFICLHLNGHHRCLNHQQLQQHDRCLASEADYAQQVRQLQQR